MLQRSIPYHNANAQEDEEVHTFFANCFNVGEMRGLAPSLAV
jgi:hypothetical protein